MTKRLTFCLMTADVTCRHFVHYLAHVSRYTNDSPCPPPALPVSDRCFDPVRVKLKQTQQAVFQWHNSSAIQPYIHLLFALCFCFNMLFYNCSVFICSTVAGRKCEINIIVIVKHRAPGLGDVITCSPTFETCRMVLFKASNNQG